MVSTFDDIIGFRKADRRRAWITLSVEVQGISGNMRGRV